VDLTGRTCIHTTSAGTQGIVNATGADEIVTGSLANARAVATYIERRQPAEVSIVAMGTSGTQSAGEDVLCARYIEALLKGAAKGFDVAGKAAALRDTAGAKFFDPKQPQYPAADFPYCVDCDRFDFVIRVGKDGDGRLVNTRLDL
jgi:2-phosphosulfolactate phosphatase